MKHLAVMVWLTFLSAASVAAQPTYKCVADIAAGIKTSENRVAQFKIDFEWRLVPYKDALPLLESDWQRAWFLGEVLDTVGPELTASVVDEGPEEIEAFLTKIEIEPYVLRRTDENPTIILAYNFCDVGDSLIICGKRRSSFLFDIASKKFKAAEVGVDDADSVVYHGTCAPFYD